MRYLLDTHVLLWYANGDSGLGAETLLKLNEASAQLCVSMASLWEMAIKESFGKLELEGGYAKWVDKYVISQPYEILTIEPPQMKLLCELDWHHRDPFDRLILCQCILSKTCLVTHDRILSKYSGLKIHLV